MRSALRGRCSVFVHTSFRGSFAAERAARGSLSKNTGEAAPMTDLLEPGNSATREPRRFRRRWLRVAAAAVASAAFVLVWFQPQKLFIDDRVDEALPTVATAASPAESEADTGTVAPTGTDEPDEPLEVVRGDFVSIDHGTTGIALVLELSDGRRVVRLEGLDTSNGPDLFVYLTVAPTDGAEAAFDDEFVNLGRLKGNQGDQNYDLPAGTDLTRFATVVIWCDRFDSAFGAADLTAS